VYVLELVFTALSRLFGRFARLFFILSALLLLFLLLLLVFSARLFGRIQMRVSASIHAVCIWQYVSGGER
jgi:hypothetical protein